MPVENPIHNYILLGSVKEVRDQGLRKYPVIPDKVANVTAELIRIYGHYVPYLPEPDSEPVMLNLDVETSRHFAQTQLRVFDYILTMLRKNKIPSRDVVAWCGGLVVQGYATPETGLDLYFEYPYPTSYARAVSLLTDLNIITGISQSLESRTVPFVDIHVRTVDRSQDQSITVINSSHPNAQNIAAVFNPRNE